VSAPCTWEEIERETVGPRTFTLRTMAARIDEAGDLWQGIGEQEQSLRGPMVTVQGLLTKQDWAEAMAASTRRPVSRRASRKT
jgi:bifunctional non-homologous end joining protein LigD